MTSFLEGGRLAFVLLAEEPFEQIQPLGPETLVEAQPLVGAGERSGVEAAQMGAAAHLATDHPGVLQRLDVLRGGRERNSASSPTVRSPRASSRSIRRRVASPRA